MYTRSLVIRLVRVVFLTVVMVVMVVMMPIVVVVVAMATVVGGKAALLVSSLCSVEPGGVQSSCHDVNR